MGKLEGMMCLQENLQRRLFATRLKRDWDKLTLKEKCEWIKENVHWVVEELHEMTRELPHMKHWKTYNPTHDDYKASFDKARAEFVDAFHFILNIAILLEFTEESLTQAYVDKNQENIKRNKEGY